MWLPSTHDRPAGGEQASARGGVGSGGCGGPLASPLPRLASPGLGRHLRGPARPLWIVMPLGLGPPNEGEEEPASPVPHEAQPTLSQRQVLDHSAAGARVLVTGGDRGGPKDGRFGT